MGATARLGVGRVTAAAGAGKELMPVPSPAAAERPLGPAAVMRTGARQEAGCEAAGETRARNLRGQSPNWTLAVRPCGVHRVAVTVTATAA